MIFWGTSSLNISNLLYSEYSYREAALQWDGTEDIMTYMHTWNTSVSRWPHSQPVSCVPYVNSCTFYSMPNICIIQFMHQQLYFCVFNVFTKIFWLETKCHSSQLLINENRTSPVCIIPKELAIKQYGVGRVLEWWQH